MNPSDVSAIIVTRGDLDLTPILETLPFEDVIVWDNSKEDRDLKVFGRYRAVLRARNDVLYVQDDDCIVPAHQLVRQYRWDRIVCNVPADHSREYRARGFTLVGFGAIFHRRFAEFTAYRAEFPMDELFLRECDRVFTATHPFVEVDLGVKKLPYGDGPDRMGREARHGQDLREIEGRLAALRGCMGHDHTDQGSSDSALQLHGGGMSTRPVYRRT